MHTRLRPPDRIIPLLELNPFIVCSICNGYLVDPHTITECLHTFCKSCLVKHIMDVSLNCPKCKILIHPTDPFIYIKHDSHMQDIVYKLLPHIDLADAQKMKVFYEKHDAANTTVTKVKPWRSKKRRTVYVNLKLTCLGPRGSEHINQPQPLTKPFVQVAALATVENLQNFLLHKLQLSSQYKVTLFYNGIHLTDLTSTIVDLKHCFGSRLKELFPLQYRIQRLPTVFTAHKSFTLQS
ncbi:unnamed protein product [Owenia fusiformis]|uniref:Uncharacterized protein n=1 Tax=Owenia fusiformis TaxID=6347 RepID=A0A8J1XFP6_OWEFU|nr:unnamed protein product [Owenia fusiformis]